MAIFNDLVEEVLLGLEGFSGSQSVIGTLAADVTSSASTMTLLGGPFEDGLNFSTGLVEVGEELVYAQSFNRTTGVYSGCLRGWRGSTAVAHVTGEIVRTNPPYPRIAVKKAINDTLRALDLFAVKTVDITTTGTDRYSLPADCERVLHLSLSPIGQVNEAWIPVNQWSVINDPAGAFESVKTLDLPAYLYGQTLRVVYAAEPTPLASLSDNFATVTGLPEWAREIVIYGAMWRLVSMPDLSRIQGIGVDQAVQAQTSPPGGGQQQAKYLLGMFQTLMAEGKMRQQNEWPAQKRWTFGGAM